VSNSEILTIKSYRHIVDSVQIELPSGYIEDGESASQAATRELEEETGYKATKLYPIGQYTLDYSMFEQKGYLFAAYGLQENGIVQRGIMEEITDIRPLSISYIKELLLAGSILNAATIVALYRGIDYHIQTAIRDANK
jgi:ADP-ribose pyrophosphatase